jgi:hypothetical protein
MGLRETLTLKETLEAATGSCGQWCLVHDIHQDNPRHTYSERICEGHHRETTWIEELRRLARLDQIGAADETRLGKGQTT